MPAIDKNRILNPGGPPKRKNGVQRRATTASGEKHVVNQHDRPSIEFKRKLGRDDQSWYSSRGDVIAVHGNIDHAKLRPDSFGRFDMFDDSTGDLDAAGRNAGHDKARQVRVVLDDLVRDPENGLADGPRVHHELRFLRSIHLLRDLSGPP